MNDQFGPQASPDGATGTFDPGVHRHSPFPPIADYGFMSDREATALQAPSGAIEWMCLPRPDSPSVFGSMLDRAAGSFRLGPSDQTVPAGRWYMPGTNVIETTWQTKAGWLIVRDALLVGPWYEDDHRDEAYRRPPSDHQAEHILLRLVKCINGQVELDMTCAPAFGYGLTEGTWEYLGEGYEAAVARGAEGDPELRLFSDLRLGIESRAAVATRHMVEGDTTFVSLEWGDPAHPGPRTWEEAEDRIWRTSDFWRGWLNIGDFPDHPWRTHLQRSALVLKGLTYAPTGALLAAATTSLPEDPGGERNWDYRYSWVRDSTFALWGLHTLGFHFEANGFFNFIRDQMRDGENLQVMYGVDGERDLTEYTLEHLEGYERSRPVRVGNGAYDQQQHDVWGALLDSIYLHHRAGAYLGEDFQDDMARQVEMAVDRWKEPDRGIWEVRGEPKHFTSSKIMCWVACDRGSRLAALLDKPELAVRWAKVADEIRADILEHGVDARGVLTQHYGTDALDAANLLAILMRFLPPDDPRARATVLAIADELTVDGLVLRYKVGDTDDGLVGEEGTFAICSFWMVSALAEIGEIERARKLCERLLAYASPLGLFAEEIDPITGRHLGNFPQAFTHLALINAVVHVIRAEEANEALIHG